MKLRNLAFLMAALASAAPASAATFVWSISATTSAWGTTANWIPLDPPPLLPGAGDTANIGFPGNYPSVWPVVGDTRFVDSLYMDWHNTNAGTTSPRLTVSTGGLLVVTNIMGMGFASGGSANPVVTISGGGTLQVLTTLWTNPFSGSNTATFNIDQGVLYLGSNGNILNTGTIIDIELGAAAFQLSGNQTTAVNAWITEGKITAGGGSLNLQVDVLNDFFGPGQHLTNVYAVVPEPSAALFGGIGSLLLLRRRRA